MDRGDGDPHAHSALDQMRDRRRVRHLWRDIPLVDMAYDRPSNLQPPIRSTHREHDVDTHILRLAVLPYAFVPQRWPRLPLLCPRRDARDDPALHDAHGAISDVVRLPTSTNVRDTV